MVQGRRLQPDQNFPRPGDRVLDLVEAQDLRAAVLVDAQRLHGRQILLPEHWYLGVG